MRELSNSEIKWVSGGNDDGGGEPGPNNIEISCCSISIGPITISMDVFNWESDDWGPDPTTEQLRDLRSA